MLKMNLLIHLNYYLIDSKIHLMELNGKHNFQNLYPYNSTQFYYNFLKVLLNYFYVEFVRYRMYFHKYNYILLKY